jgi:hypothetical protein
VNINDNIIFDWKTKEGKVKIILGQNLYYIIEEHLILAIEECKND